MPDGKEIKFEIKRAIGILSDSGKTQKEFNIVKWDDRDPKFDIRVWKKEGHSPMKGISLNAEEIEALKAMLDQILSD